MSGSSSKQKMAGPPLLRCCVVLVVLSTSAAMEMISWPECPCEYIPGYGTCARVLPRTIPESARELNVNLQNCNIREITSVDLPYANARWIDLRRNYIQRLDARVFRHLSSVNYISLESNKIYGKHIHYGVFQDCKQLKGIGLSGNDMREAPDNLLEGLDNLEQLFLVDASLYEVPAFARRTNLTSLLHLSNNEITLNNPNAFSALNYLKILHLDHNLIRFIPEDIFQPVKYIETIRLDYNRITYIPDNLFAGLTKLKYLHLQSNAIQYVSQFVFKDCNKLEELDLSKNKITQLSENFLPKPTKRFYFSENPWECKYLNQLLNQVRERQIEHNNVGKTPVEYTCYKCIDSAFTNSVENPSNRKLSVGTIGQLNYTISDHCRE